MLGTKPGVLISYGTATAFLATRSSSTPMRIVIIPVLGSETSRVTGLPVPPTMNLTSGLASLGSSSTIVQAAALVRAQ